MDSKKLLRQLEDYKRIEQAISFIEHNFKAQPPLDEIAAAVCLSKYHFQRLFRRWAGISPTQFMQYLTLDYAREKLAEAENVLGASFEAGLSGPGRLHDLFVTFDAMTPGEFKRLGAGLKIEYGCHPTPFGQCLIALTARGICHLGFIDREREGPALRRLRENWPGALLCENAVKTGRYMKQIFSADKSNRSEPFHIFLKGTNFQVNVWRALLTIPPGHVVSYQDIAAYIGKPKAVRAAAGAIALNPVGFLIPCHRVIAKSGRIHKYRWGTARKKAILGWEAARSL